MLFPEKAKKAIAKTFYDKILIYFPTKKEVDEEGGITTVYGMPETFEGNIRFSDLGTVVTELGLTEEIDICITAPVDTQIHLSDEILCEDNNYYIVTKVIPSDSHLTIVGKKKCP